MIGSSGYPYRMIHHLTCFQSRRKTRRYKNIIESQMRIPCRERVALDVWIQQSEAVSVAGVKHDLDRFALNVATADPYQASDPRRHPLHVENLPRRESIEVADEHMKTVLMSLNSL